jgi:TATA-box binding protein (TBP) (component of TFIID and TFIIIB)
MQIDGCENILISTITASGKYNNILFNLFNIGKYLEIDNDIIGIKYSYGNILMSKGVYLTTCIKKLKKKTKKINPVMFYNQISIILNYQNNHVNCKLFKNGSIQITGCQNIKYLDHYMILLYNKLLQLQNKVHSIILTRDHNNLLVDHCNFIYGDENNNCDFKVIGFYINDNIFFNNKQVYPVNSIFLSKKINKYSIPEYYDNNGKLIDKPLSTLNKFTKTPEIQIIKYNCHTIENTTKYNCHTIENTTKYNCHTIENTTKYNCHAIENTTNENTKTNKSTINYVIDINCINICFKLNIKSINRYKIYNDLLKNGYMCIYNPEVYSGVKFIYKLLHEDYGNYKTNEINEIQTNKNGICYCSNKCICQSITFMIFQTGKVIGSGFRSEQQIKKVTHSFINILKNALTGNSSSDNSNSDNYNIVFSF